MLLYQFASDCTVRASCFFADLKPVAGRAYMEPSGNGQSWHGSHSTHPLSKTRPYAANGRISDTCSSSKVHPMHCFFLPLD